VDATGRGKIDGPFGYVPAGDIERDELQKIARGVY
jgi:anti-sigma factor RsiW